MGRGCRRGWGRWAVGLYLSEAAKEVSVRSEVCLCANSGTRGPEGPGGATGRAWALHSLAPVLAAEGTSKELALGPRTTWEGACGVHKCQELSLSQCLSLPPMGVAQQMGEMGRAGRLFPG